MQCVTPMWFWYRNGDRKHGHVVSRAEVAQALQTEPNNLRHMREINHPLDMRVKYMQIPCRHCWACQLNYAAEWATRIYLESKKSEHNYFITLTYDDEHVPINPLSNKMTLRREDIQRFVKRLRDYFSYKAKKAGTDPPEIKYFCCGEYGEETQRPHYHIILMNCPLDINQFYDTHIDGNFKEHWKSPEIERLWSSKPIDIWGEEAEEESQNGMIDIASVEWSSAAYVARYCTKKIFHNEKEYEEAGIMKEFVGMSNGIGMDYFEKHYEDIYETDEMILRTIRGNIGSYKPPKAFDKKMEEINEALMREIKIKRQIAGDRAKKLKESKTSYTDKELLNLERRKILEKAKMLPREGIQGSLA